jgi:hypothetical protein
MPKQVLLLSLSLLLAFSPNLQPPASSLATPAPLPPVEFGDGVTGSRVQAVYLYSSDGNQLDQAWSSLGYAGAGLPGGATLRRVIQQVAGYVDAAYLHSAWRHDPTQEAFRRVRWVTDNQGNVDVQAVNVTGGLDHLSTVLGQLGSRSDRDYLGFNGDRFSTACPPDTLGCALTFRADTSAGAQNQNNSGPNYAEINIGDWWAFAWVAVHELTHMLGAVQQSTHTCTPYRCWSNNDGAPHASSQYHDCAYFDVMILAGNGDSCPAGTPQCSSDPSLIQWSLDACGDDYFNPVPQSGGYLAAHWNVASSAFLEANPADDPRLYPWGPSGAQWWPEWLKLCGC